MIAVVFGDQRLPDPCRTIIRISRLCLDQALVRQLHVAMMQVEQAEVRPADGALGAFSIARMKQC